MVSGNASNISLSPSSPLFYIYTQGSCFRTVFAILGYVTLTIPPQSEKDTSQGHRQLGKRSVLASCFFVTQNCMNTYGLSRRHNSMDIRLIPCKTGVTKMLASDYVGMPVEVTNDRVVQIVDDRCHLNMDA